MLSLQFIAQNIHFANSLFAALVFFAVFWLYFDAWAAQSRKSLREMLKWSGFLFVAVSFVVYGTLIEQSTLGKSIFGDTSAVVSNVLSLIGYFIIIIGQLADPLQAKPVTHGLGEEIEAQAIFKEEEKETKKHPVDSRDKLSAGLAA